MLLHMKRCPRTSELRKLRRFRSLTGAIYFTTILSASVSRVAPILSLSHSSDTLSLLQYISVSPTVKRSLFCNSSVDIRLQNISNTSGTSARQSYSEPPAAMPPRHFRPPVGCLNATAWQIFPIIEQYNSLPSHSRASSR